MKTYFFSIFPNENFLDLMPYQYGWEQCAPLHSFGPSVRNHYLFHYIISGKGTLISHATDGNAHEYELGAGQGFLICPGQINYYAADGDDPWKYAWMEFDGMRAADALWSAGLEQDQPIYRPIKIIADQCGYPNQLHFSQAFKKYYGLPPREWRKQNKAEK